ncbi:MAG: GAF domain-containing protein [Bacteroidota bacterium]
MMEIDLNAANEVGRIENLKKYKILYTAPEPIFDQLAAIAATMLDAPVAMINFVDGDKVWTKANQNGESGMEVERNTSLCSLAILNDKVTVFDDLQKQVSTISNPMVAGESGFRFYAAAPITTDEGFNVGSVCVVDRTSREFNIEEQNKLEWVAVLVRKEMNKRIENKRMIGSAVPA